MEISFSTIFPIQEPWKFKLHLASWNGEADPLEVFVRSQQEWNAWNEYRGKRDDFNREFVFSLIDFTPEKENDQWLFGGAYRVESRPPHNGLDKYKVDLLDEWKPFIGRLKLSLKRRGRARVVRFEEYYKTLQVSEILRNPYLGEAFPGYDQIDVGFRMLETIFAIQRMDWRAALENAKGVYLITDASNGKRYVGAAYGDTGIWSRWACYVQTGHGYNDELTQVIKDHGVEHARKYFKFALLEHRTPKTDVNVIREREIYWKKALLTRDPEYGYNRN